MVRAFSLHLSLGRLGILAAVAAFALFACVWNLGASSISSGDEGIHVRVVQEMIETGRWISPTLDGEPYLGKPPFKLALSKATVLLVGDSNLAFRILDGLAGLGTIAVTFLLALRMFRSWGIAFMASFLMATNRVFLFRHVVREAVQDSMLVFLSTLALFFGWELLSLISRGDGSHAIRSVKRLALLVGFLCGLAILTKTVAGFFPLIIMYATLLIRGGIRRLFSRDTRAIWLASAIAMVTAGLYYGLNAFLIPEAGNNLIVVNLHERLLGAGFHHVRQWDLYFKLVFRSGRVAPVGLVALGLFTGVVGCVRRELCYQYLLAWVVVPLLGFSVLSSRLDWYLAPAFPGLALLSAAGLVQGVATLARVVTESTRVLQRLAAMAGYGILLAYTTGSLGAAAVDVTERVLKDGPPSQFEQICREIRSILQRSSKSEKVALYGLSDALSPHNSPYNLHKKIYLSMLAPYLTTVTSVDELVRLREEGTLGFVIAHGSQATELQKLAPCAQRLLPGRILKAKAAEGGSWPPVVFMAISGCTDGDTNIGELLSVAGREASDEGSPES